MSSPGVGGPTGHRRRPAVVGDRSAQVARSVGPPEPTAGSRLFPGLSSPDHRAQPVPHRLPKTLHQVQSPSRPEDHRCVRAHDRSQDPPPGRLGRRRPRHPRRVQRPRAPQPQPPSGPGYRLTGMGAVVELRRAGPPSAGSLTDEVMSPLAEVTARPGSPSPSVRRRRPGPDLVGSTGDHRRGRCVLLGRCGSAAPRCGASGASPEERHVIRDVRLSGGARHARRRSDPAGGVLHELRTRRRPWTTTARRSKLGARAMNPYVGRRCRSNRSGDDAGLAATETRARPAADPAAAVLQLFGGPRHRPDASP